MYQIKNHPIISIKTGQQVNFLYNGKKINAEKGLTIATALHRAGYPVHSHSLQNRPRSMECGIGKCGACEMLVDGEIKRICITMADNVRVVEEIPKDYIPEVSVYTKEDGISVYKTKVVILGAGPAGLATREILNKYDIPNIVIDSNPKIGGQFIMQTHQFFFFEKEKKYGGMRGFEIADLLAGNDRSGIFLNSTIWDIFEGNRIVAKNTETQEVFYVDCEHFVVAAGAIPFTPAFHNDDLPGVYTAAVVQKMMNNELTLLGKNFLTVGAGNIGYLTSYQLKQAGANVQAIIEAQDKEGGFPVQANRVRRLGIPVLLSHMIIEAIPNISKNGIKGAVIAKAENFKPVPGSEKIIHGIDAINICTGLIPDDDLLIKGREMFGRNCYGAGDAIRIGEGTSAVLRGKQVAYEILDNMGIRYNYDQYLATSKEYFDSQQHPVKIAETPKMPDKDRLESPFVLIDCLYGFACNPCAFACPYGAITKSSSSTIPDIDYNLCTGCMKCVSLCPGLAIFGFNIKKKTLFLPVEFDMEEKTEVVLVDNNADEICEGIIDKVLKKPNLTHVVRIKITHVISDNEMMQIRGFIEKGKEPKPLTLERHEKALDPDVFMCHCDDVRLDDVMNIIGDRKYISVDEVKHTTHLGMGPCRGKRCIPRLRTDLKSKGIALVGSPTPRAPLSNQIRIGELYPAVKKEKTITSLHNKKIKTVKVKSFIAGGGIAGSSLFRYLAEAGYDPFMINFGFGSSWRNIAGGRPVFSLPELSDIAGHNLEIFNDLNNLNNIDFRLIHYITFAHDELMYKALQESMKWQNAVMIAPKDFRNEISPFFNKNNDTYLAALKTKDCWQASPGKTIDLLRKMGSEHGGTLMEDTELIDLEKQGNTYHILVRDHAQNYTMYETDVFINALGHNGHIFAEKVGIQTSMYPVKHQAFITRRLPMMGIGENPLDMLIDRRNYKGFSAVYGQQLADTGQIIGCASPAVEPLEADKNVKFNSKDFIEIVSEVFINWIPQVSSVGFQALWAGYYTEPRMIIDVDKGLFIGLRGQGFMLGQYLARLYVDKLLGKKVPDYFARLNLNGDALLEKAFK